MTSCTLVGVFLQRARQTHVEALGLEQWHVTPQDVCVISRVCQKLFGVAVETKCNIEPPTPPTPFLPVASLSLEKKLSVRESQASSPTLAAAARLAAMIHGKERMYSNNVKVDQVSFLLSIQWFKCDQCELQMNPFFCFRWLDLIWKIALQVRRRRALYPLVATHAGIASSRLLQSPGPLPRNAIHPHHTMTKRESKVLGRRSGEGHSLASASPLPSLPPRLFLPLRWLPLFVCLREHRGIKLCRVYQFLLLCLAEDAVWRRQVGAWGKTRLLFSLGENKYLRRTKA